MHPLDFFSRGKVIARAHAQTHTIMICMTVGMRVMGLLMLRGVFIVRNFLRRRVWHSECQQKMKHRTIKIRSYHVYTNYYLPHFKLMYI